MMVFRIVMLLIIVAILETQKSSMEGEGGLGRLGRFVPLGG